MNAFDGAVLAPWPNRIDGVTLTSPETATGCRSPSPNAIPRCMASSPMRNGRWSSAPSRRPVSSTRWSRRRVSVRVRSAGGLRTRRGGAAHARTGPQHGVGPAPFGFGFHPWLSPGTAPSGTTDLVDGALVDEAQLVIPAAHWHETDERLIPTAVRPFDDGTAVPADHASDDSACMVCKDFRALRLIGGTILDDAYGSPRRGDDGWSRARLRGTDLREVVVGMGPGFRTWQACTGDGLEEDLARRAIAIEPMTCPPNAFAAGEAGEDFDVVAPGDELVVEWSIALTEDDDTSCSLPQ